MAVHKIPQISMRQRRELNELMDRGHKAIVEWMNALESDIGTALDNLELSASDQEDGKLEFDWDAVREAREDYVSGYSKDEAAELGIDMFSSDEDKYIDLTPRLSIRIKNRIKALLIKLNLFKTKKGPSEDSLDDILKKFNVFGNHNTDAPSDKPPKSLEVDIAKLNSALPIIDFMLISLPALDSWNDLISRLQALKAKIRVHTKPSRDILLGPGARLGIEASHSDEIELSSKEIQRQLAQNALFNRPKTTRG